MTTPIVNSGLQGGGVPIMSLSKIAQIVGEAVNETYTFESASLQLSSRYGDKLTEFNNTSSEAAHKTAALLDAVQDINITLTVLSVMTLPLGAVALPALGSSLGLAAMGEAASAAAGGMFMQLGGSTAAVTQFAISAPMASLGAAQAGMQVQLADTQKVSDLVKGARNTVSQNSKKANDSIANDGETIQDMNTSLGEAISNYASAQQAYKVKN